MLQCCIEIREGRDTRSTELTYLLFYAGCCFLWHHSLRAKFTLFDIFKNDFLPSLLLLVSFSLKDQLAWLFVSSFNCIWFNRNDFRFMSNNLLFFWISLAMLWHTWECINSVHELQSTIFIFLYTSTDSDVVVVWMHRLNVFWHKLIYKWLKQIFLNSNKWLKLIIRFLVTLCCCIWLDSLLFFTYLQLLCIQAVNVGYTLCSALQQMSINKMRLKIVWRYLVFACVFNETLTAHTAIAKQLKCSFDYFFFLFSDEWQKKTCW